MEEGISEIQVRVTSGLSNGLEQLYWGGDWGVLHDWVHDNPQVHSLSQRNKMYFIPI